MSADRWTICPKCRIKAEEQQAENERRAQEAYGKVPPSQYEELRQIVLAGIELEQTLREDFGQGILKDGEYYVRYHGHCETCGFDFRYKYDEKVKL